MGDSVDRKAVRKRQRGEDRKIISAHACQGLSGVRHQRLAAAARQAGVAELISTKIIQAWNRDPSTASQWFVDLLVEAAASQAKRAAVEERAAFESEVKDLSAQARVERRLLANGVAPPRFKRYSREGFFATDMVFRAMKELVGCDGDVSWLCDLGLAALQWAGVDPGDRRTWFLEAGSA